MRSGLLVLLFLTGCVERLITGEDNDGGQSGSQEGGEDEESSGGEGSSSGDAFPEPPRPVERETIYVNSSDTLFAFDPVSLTLAQLGRFTFDDGGTASVTDIAIDRDGLLYALSAGMLYVCDPLSVVCTAQGPSSANSAGFAEFGALDPDNDVLVLVEGSEVVQVRVDGSGPETTVVGMLDGYSSSGDVMPLEGTTMLLSSPSDGGDVLIAFDAATAEVLGPLMRLPGLSYGLAGFGGEIWVFTDLGEILRVDENESAQQMLRVDVRLWGAATHPQSR
ncbi:MAG: hypothetical protein KUG77_07145 [Nannocystaceae bacterium]|nr:hypothetical protein [Nannocystaceae bacterium]